MNPQKLDHVALYVSDAERVVEKLRSRLPVRTLEETDEFILVGRSPELGKITLFRADGPRERAGLMRVGIAVPCAETTSTLDLEELDALLVPGPTDGEVDLDHVALRVSDPEASARAWADYGFDVEPSSTDVHRVRLGNAFIELHPGTPFSSTRPILNHLGLLVQSLDEVERAVAERGFEVTREVDAENSRALFVLGPDAVEVEYIEHKPSFALA